MKKILTLLGVLFVMTGTANAACTPTASTPGQSGNQPAAFTSLVCGSGDTGVELHRALDVKLGDGSFQNNVTADVEYPGNGPYSWGAYIFTGCPWGAGTWHNPWRQRAWVYYTEGGVARYASSTSGTSGTLTLAC